MRFRRTTRNLEGSRAPGNTGVEFTFSTYRRPFIVSSPARGQVCITVGCHVIPLTAEEAEALANEVLDTAAKSIE